MVAHVGALHDHVHVVQVGKDRILQALTVVGADRFQNIRVLLNDRFFCLMMDGEQTCPAIMYILRTGMLQHELPVGQRIEDMVEIFIQTEHGCNVIHCAGGPLLFHNGAQIRIDRSKCAGIERFQTDMGFQNFAQVAGLLHLLAVDQADKASPFGEHIHSTISSQAMQCFTHGNTAAFKLGSKAHLAELFAGEQIQTADLAAEKARVLASSRTLFNIDSDKLLRVMDVNWLGTVMACQVFAVNMVGRDGCSIINITSMAAYDALSMVPAYASSKAAVDMFTKWLSNYLSNTAGKVRVNAVAPGYFLTPLNHDMYVNPDGSYTQRYWNVIHRTPMGRLGDPKELVGALRFFADPEMSGYITGQVIAVDGGFLSCPGI